MAFDRAILNRYKYFRDGGRVDQAFIESVLLPGLAQQAKFAGGAIGVELPHSDNIKTEDVEYLPIKEAAQLAIDWFGEHHNLETKEERALENLLGKASYRQMADTLELVLRSRVQDPQKLVTARLTQNVAELKHIKDLEAIEAKSNTQYKPATQLRDFYKLQLEVSRLAAMGVPSNYIDQFLPKNLATSINSSLTQRRFLEILTNNPTLLQQAKINYGDPDMAMSHLTHSFERVVKQSPELAGLLNFTGMDEFRSALYQTAARINRQLEAENVSLDDYANSKLAASYALPHLLPHQDELLTQLSRLPTFTTDEHRKTFARTLLATVNSSVTNKLTADQIVTLAGKKLGLTNDQISNIQSLVLSAGLSPAIEIEQNSIYFDVSDRQLTPSERSLLQKGINPFHAHFEPDDLLKEARSILAEPNLNLADAQVKMSRLYEQSLSSNNPDTVELSRFRSWLDRHHTVSYIYQPSNANLRRLAGRSRTERWLTDVSSRLHSIETKFYNKWFEIDEKLPWNIATRKVFEWYDQLAEKAVVTLPWFKGKKLRVPILNVGNFILDQWDKFKITSTSKAVKFVSGKNWGAFEGIRKTFVLTLREYRLGGHTTSGAVFHYTHKLWGKTLTWAATKTGLSSVFKYSAASGARIATRFLIKIGGKALAKAGVKVIAALAAAGTVIGAAISVVMAIALVFDLLKMAYDFVKKFFTDKNFRKYITKLSLVFAGVMAFFSGIRFGSIIFALLGTLIVGLLVAALWAVGLVVGISLIYNIHQATVRLDVGTSEIQIPGGGSTTVDCFTFVEAGKTFPQNSSVNPSSTTPGWSPGDIALMTSAIEKMKSTHGKFIEAVCRGGNINLWRDTASSVSWGGWAMSGGDIRLYNLGVTSALYTLSHELGHIYAVRVGGISAFMRAGLVVWDNITQSCRNNIYPASPSSEGMCYGENFAELISWVISGHKSPPSNWVQWIFSTIFK